MYYNSSSSKETNFEKVLLFLLAVSMQLGCFLAQIYRIPQYLFMMAMVCTVFLILYHKRKKIIIPAIVYKMGLWLLWCLILSCIIMPYVMEYIPRFPRIAYETVCVIVAIVIVIIAYNIVTVKMEETFLRYFSYFAIFIIVLSIIMSPLGYKELFYFYDVRFCGLAGNPNDYMEIVFVALPYFLFSKRESRMFKLFSTALLLCATLMSGAKGGTIALLVYVFILIGEKAFLVKSSNRGKYVLVFLVLCLVGIMGLCALPYVRDELETLAGRLPSLERVIYLIYHFKDALSSGGSLRIEAWMGAIKLINLSPILGIGIGGSSTVLQILNYSFYDLPPHNMYLEFLSQSGLMIFVLVFLAVLKKIRQSFKLVNTNVLILRHSLYLLLFNGIFASSNWFCLFWIVVGLFLGVTNRSLIELNTTNEEEV